MTDKVSTQQRYRAIHGFLVENGPKTAKEIAEGCGMDSDTTRRMLAKMRGVYITTDHKGRKPRYSAIRRP